MALDWSFTHVLGLSAAVLVLALGAFVVAARPRAVVARAFFAFAVFDGFSTALFELRDMSTIPADEVYFYATYFYFYIASIALLLGFGLVFPRPLASTRWRTPLVVILVAVTLAVILGFALDHGAFWSVVLKDGRASFHQGTGERLVNASLALTIAFVTLKLTRDFLSAPGEGFRRQAAFVLAGLLVGYGSLPVAILARDISTSRALFTSHDAATQAMIWSYAAAAGAICYAAARFAGAPSLLARERRAVLGATVVVAVIGTLALIAPTAIGMLQIVGLTIYPILLGYSILRYAVFDIHAHVRRAVILAAAAGAAAAVFVLVENLVQNAIQEQLSNLVTARWLASAVAALLAALVGVPVAALGRRLAPNLLPDAPQDSLHRRRLEIYRHSVEGAAADGILDKLELSVLARLRQSLGVSATEHDLIVADVRARVAQS